MSEQFAPGQTLMKTMVPLNSGRGWNNTMRYSEHAELDKSINPKLTEHMAGRRLTQG